MSAHITIETVVPALAGSGHGSKWSQRDMRFMTIGISGTGPGSGKDTAAKLVSLLLEERGIRTSIQKFATPIRQQVKEETGVPIEVSETTEGKNILLTKFRIVTVDQYLEAFVSLLEKEIEKETEASIKITEMDDGRYILLGGRGITVGRYLQLIGSFMKEKTGNPNFWIDKLFAGFTPGEVVIISDVRFPLEQEAVKKRRGVNILINSSRQTDETQMAGRDVAHESERALDGAVMDYMVENSGSVDELSDKLKQLVDGLFPRTVQ